MPATGIIRNIDNLGRLVIPKELRRKFGIKDGDPVEIFTDCNSIILRRYYAAGSIKEIVDRLQAELQEAEELENREKAIELTDELLALLQGKK
mgnify:CR=1 FL=1|jgi:AbrB family looped-hinge helix DNA binding protein